jgi:hypothetical protein
MKGNLNFKFQIVRTRVLLEQELYQTIVQPEKLIQPPKEIEKDHA